MQKPLPINSPSLAGSFCDSLKRLRRDDNCRLIDPRSGRQPIQARCQTDGIADAVVYALDDASCRREIGAQPGSASLGLMLREAQNYLSFAPHLALAPGLVMSLVALGLLLISDGLRRDLDLPATDRLDAAA